jgi:hypothetical protein
MPFAYHKPGLLSRFIEPNYIRLQTKFLSRFSIILSISLKRGRERRGNSLKERGYFGEGMGIKRGIFLERTRTRIKTYPTPCQTGSSPGGKTPATSENRDATKTPLFSRNNKS